MTSPWTALFIMRGVPEHIRSDDGPEFIAAAVQRWIKTVGAKTSTIMSGLPWEDGQRRKLQRSTP